MFLSGGDLAEALLTTQIVWHGLEVNSSSGAPGQQGELLSTVVVRESSEEE